MPDYYELAKQFLTNIYGDAVRVKDYEDLGYMLSQAYYVGRVSKDKETYEQWQSYSSFMDYMADEDYVLPQDR